MAGEARRSIDRRTEGVASPMAWRRVKEGRDETHRPYSKNARADFVIAFVRVSFFMECARRHGALLASRRSIGDLLEDETAGSELSGCRSRTKNQVTHTRRTRMHRRVFFRSFFLLGGPPPFPVGPGPPQRGKQPATHPSKTKFKQSINHFPPKSIKASFPLFVSIPMHRLASPRAYHSSSSRITRMNNPSLPSPYMK